MIFQLHPTGDLFRAPTLFQAINDCRFLIWVSDKLSVDCAALFVLGLGDNGMVAVQLRHFSVLLGATLQLAVQGGWIALQLHGYFTHRNFREAPLCQLTAFVHT